MPPVHPRPFPAMTQRARLRVAASALALGTPAPLWWRSLGRVLRSFGRILPSAAASGLGALALSGPAVASCVSMDNSGYRWEACQGDSGTGSSKHGKAGDNVVIDTGTASHDAGYIASGYLLNAPVGYGVVMGGSIGGRGQDEAEGGIAGTVNLTNGGTVSLSEDADQGFLSSLLLGYSIGGAGDPQNDNYRSSGGGGGSGNNVNVTNAGLLEVLSLTARAGRGISGILAHSGGGTGGAQNGGLTGDQAGGAGGPGWSVFLTNRNAVTLGSQNAPLRNLDYAWGIAARSVGGTGGADNGAGGASNLVSVVNGDTSDAPIYIHADTSGSVRGIYTLSRGADGMASQDSSDDGGTGADAFHASVTTHSDITVINTGEASELSGGIVALNQGGNGGAGYEDGNGGQGGVGVPTDTKLAVNVLDGATVSVHGDNVLGVVALASGGKGGAGDDDSSGGTGGYGGWVDLTIEGNIRTDGTNAYGLLGQSIGGQGGDAANAGGLLGEAGGGGFGGNADTVQADLNGDIETYGDFAAGVTLHSIGGGGGTGGDFVDVLGGGAGNGGAGGNGDHAIFSSDGGTITTNGAHSLGILVQSIGGSGGHGGIAAGATLELGGDGGEGAVQRRRAVSDTSPAAATAPRGPGKKRRVSRSTSLYVSSGLPNGPSASAAPANAASISGSKASPASSAPPAIQPSVSMPSP